MSVAFFIAAACTSCTSLYDPDKLSDEPQKGGDGGTEDDGDGAADDDDVAGEDAAPDPADAGEEPPPPDAGVYEPDGGAQCEIPGQRGCNPEDEFYECSEELQCVECGREDLACCTAEPFCEPGGIINLGCVANRCAQIGLGLP